MTLGAVLGAALNSGAAHPYGLFMNGFDVIKEPVASPRYGVPTDSIEVVEAGSGGVSSLRFTIDDPSLVITVLGNEEVVLWDFTRDAPMFGGYVDSFTVTVDFGQQGRSYEVLCSGYETLLDTCAVGGLVINFATANRDGVSGGAIQETEMIQTLAGFTPLSHGTTSTATETPTQALPVQHRDAVVPYATIVDFSGMSVRAGWQAYLAVAQSANGAVDPGPGFNIQGDAPADRINDYWMTVDFYKGLRFAAYAPAHTGAPVSKWFSDYTTLTLTDTPTGTPAEDLDYSEDHSPSAIVNGVYVKGGNAAGSGMVSNGQIPRREVMISDSGILTGQAKLGRATQIINAKSAPAGRGTFSMTSYTPVATIHPGSPLSITDARLSGQLTHAIITEIRKTLNSGLTQNWTITYQLYTDPGTGLALQGGTSSGGGSAMETIKSSL